MMRQAKNATLVRSKHYRGLTVASNQSGRIEASQEVLCRAAARKTYGARGVTLNVDTKNNILALKITVGTEQRRTQAYKQL